MSHFITNEVILGLSNAFYSLSNVLKSLAEMSRSQSNILIQIKLSINHFEGLNTIQNVTYLDRIS
jgi:hypothetical protein